MDTISELKQQLKQAQKLEAIGKLAAGVAHEINSPMQFLGDNLSYLTKSFEFLNRHIEKLNSYVNSDTHRNDPLRQSLAEEWKTIQDKEILQQIEEALTDSRDGVEQVTRIVAAMKAFAHPGGIDKTSVNINQSLETAILVSRNEWKYVAQIERIFDDNLPFVLGDEGDLNQVFLNLIINAAHAIRDKDKAMPCRGQIRISTRFEENLVRVAIEDTGCGIPKAIRDKVLTPRFTTKKSGDGTGLGLAIANSVITQKHKGRLSFESEEGIGTRFLIDLPICDQEAKNTSNTNLNHLDLIRD